VPLEDTAVPTQTCDEVHFGGVEIFNRGRWGAVCIAAGDAAQFTLDAEVACRQLGYRFGRMYDVLETIGGYYDYSPFGQYDTLPSEFAWASEVVCTGPEARLQDCLFPESSNDTLSGLPTTGVLDSCFQILGVVCSRFDLVGAASLTAGG